MSPSLPTTPSKSAIFSELTRVVLLPVNPYLAHVYWDVAPDDLKKIEKLFGRPPLRAQPVLRFRDITYIVFDGTNENSRFDIEIDLAAKNWYVHLWSSDKSYCVDLGLRTEDGLFHLVTRSNTAQIPRAWPSKKMEETCIPAEGEYHCVEPVPSPPRNLPEPMKAGRESPKAVVCPQVAQPPDEPSRLQIPPEFFPAPQEEPGGHFHSEASRLQISPEFFSEPQEESCRDLHSEPSRLQIPPEFFPEPQEESSRDLHSELNSELIDEKDLTAVNERSFHFGICSSNVEPREENTGPNGC